MDSKKILSVIAIIGGEALLVTAFFLFKGETPDNIFILNLVVSSLIYCLMFFDVLIPWIAPGDRSGKRLGSMGIRWVFTGIYTVAAIALMLLANLVFEWEFQIQLIAHCALAFVLLLSIVGLMHASDKISSVYAEQQEQRRGLDSIKMAVSALSDKAALEPGLPEIYREKVALIEESVRFISPSDSPEAAELESRIEETVRELTACLHDSATYSGRLDQLILKVERQLQKRKSVYSN